MPENPARGAPGRPASAGMTETGNRGGMTPLKQTYVLYSGMALSPEQACTTPLTSPKTPVCLLPTPVEITSTLVYFLYTVREKPSASVSTNQVRKKRKETK